MGFFCPFSTKYIYLFFVSLRTVFSTKIHHAVFVSGVCLLAYGMMMGTVPTSVPQILLLANWLFEGRWRQKWEALRQNALFWLLVLVFFAHAAGLFYSDDLKAGWDDLRTKLPMLFLPVLFFSSSALSKKEYIWVLRFFLFGCLTNTLWCNFYTHVLHQTEVLRNASRFMSHIRLGLYLNIAIAAVFYLFTRSSSSWKKILLLALAVYFLFCFYSLGLASGLMNFLILAFIFSIVLIIRKRQWILFAVFLAAFTSLLFYVQKVLSQQLLPQPGAQNTRQVQTPWGSSYIHFEEQGQMENGNYVLINIELSELSRVWNRRVPGDTFQYKPAHNLQRYEVLVRYLASQGKNKDSLAVMQLTAEDLENIQKNIVNVNLPEWSFFHRRIYEFVNEFDEFRNDRHINGHSVTMRPYFWKAALAAISGQVWMGVGTGDVQKAMNESYVRTQSPLHEEWYKRPHNQLITITLALGLTGLLIFLLSLFYPLYFLRKDLPLLYWVFFVVLFLSFLMEDTLETQAGQTFYAFFNTLFLSAAWFRRQQRSVTH